MLGPMGDELREEPDVVHGVRLLAEQMHPAELVVSVVRGVGWGTDPGGVIFLEDGGVELYFDDGADSSLRVTRAELLGALADVCMERGYPDEHDMIRAVLADPAHATVHPAHDVARARARCARLGELLEAHGWERRGDELHHAASGSGWSTAPRADHVEALRAALVDDARRAGASATAPWLAYQRAMLAAIDALLAEERGQSRGQGT